MRFHRFIVPGHTYRKSFVNRLRELIMREAPRAKVVRPRSLDVVLRIDAKNLCTAGVVAKFLAEWEVDFRHEMWG